MKLSLPTNHAEYKLIKDCVCHKREAQKRFYNRFAAQMFGVCLRYAHDYQQAEDLLQEGFIKVFKNLDKYRGEGSFEGWIRRIFVNAAIEQFRKNQHMLPVHDLQIVNNLSVRNEALTNLAVEKLMGFIQALSPGYRTVFNLYAIEGYSHKEIANMLGISEGTSKSQLARARYILQRVILKNQESKYESILQSS